MMPPISSFPSSGMKTNGSTLVCVPCPCLRTRRRLTVSPLFMQHAEGVRGLELSELVSFGGRLLTCDDRSGIIFEVLDARGDSPRVVPRHIMMEGDGNTDKGFKCEWMAVKGDKLYVGSFGKEYTTPDGGVKNRNNMWVMVFNAKFDMVREDWVQQFTNLREHFGYAFPAYLLHETVMWSEVSPRVSQTACKPPA